MPPDEQQVVATPEAPAAAAPEATIADQAAAARAAMNEVPETPIAAPVAGTPERGADGKFLPKGEQSTSQVSPTPEAPAEEEGGSKIGAILRAREKANDIREAGKSEAETIIATAREKAQAVADQIVAEARSRAEKEMTEWRTKLRTSPLQAIKDGGIDTRTLVDEVTREGTPEWQAQKRTEAALEKIATENAELKAWRDSMTAKETEWEKQRISQGRQQTERHFLTIFPEDSAARTLWDESDIIAKAHAAADLYREKSNGQVASLEDLRDYLEEQAAKKLAGIRTPAESGTSAAQQAAKKVSANQPKANGPRALSAASASERRTSPKPFHEMSETEQRAAQIEAATAAMRGS